MLEPLTKATGKQLEPIRVWPEITLTLHTDGDNFIAELNRQPNYEVIDWLMKTFPESEWLGARNYDKQRLYRLGATDFTALTIQHCFPEEQLLYGDEEAELRYQYLCKRFVAQDARAALQANYKLHAAEPEMPKGWVDHPDFPLSKCQRTAVAFGFKQEASALFMDRGTGKTATAINRFCNEAVLKKSMYRVLIVCPNQVRMNWQREIEKFATCRGKVTIIRGTKEKRVRAFVQAAMSEPDCEFSAVIVGYDTMAAADELYVKYRMWNLVVCDESHFFKSSYTKRWKTMLKLREASHQRMILTGTPIGNSMMDLWTQFEFLGLGLSGFTKFGNFRKFHGDFMQVGEGIQKLIGHKNVPLIQERLARMSFTVTKEEAGLDLPDKVYDLAEAEMTTKQAKVYKQVANDLYAELEDRLSGDVSPMTIENALTSLMRLAQITSGFITFDAVHDPENGVEISPRKIQQIEESANPKIEAVREMLRESDPQAKTLIWCCFVEDIKQLEALLIDEGIGGGSYYGATSEKDRQINNDAFNNDPNFRVLICNPQTAGEGLNLLGYDVNNPEESQTYCDHEIFFSCNWSAIQRGQAEDRAHRRGTRMPVRITDLIVPDTIDEEIRNRVKDKQSGAMSVLDIKNILESL